MSCRKRANHFARAVSPAGRWHYLQSSRLIALPKVSSKPVTVHRRPAANTRAHFRVPIVETTQQANSHVLVLAQKSPTVVACDFRSAPPAQDCCLVPHGDASFQVVAMPFVSILSCGLGAGPSCWASTTAVCGWSQIPDSVMIFTGLRCLCPWQAGQPSRHRKFSQHTVPAALGDGIPSMLGHNSAMEFMWHTLAGCFEIGMHLQIRQSTFAAVTYGCVCRRCLVVIDRSFLRALQGASVRCMHCRYWSSASCLSWGTKTSGRYISPADIISDKPAIAAVCLQASPPTTCTRSVFEVRNFSAEFVSVGNTNAPA